MDRITRGHQVHCQWFASHLLHFLRPIVLVFANVYTSHTFTEEKTIDQDKGSGQPFFWHDEMDRKAKPPL
jgi:hypothetical protein